MVVTSSRYRPSASRASNRAMARLRNPRNRRGSTVLLVITILSLLVLLAITLTFSSRMELTASQNYAIGTQNRIAGRTAVEAVAIDLQSSLPVGALSPLDLTLNEEFLRNRPGTSASRARLEQMEDLPVDEILRVRAQGNLDDPYRRYDEERKPITFSPLQKSGTGEVVVLDASARVNINAADEVVLAGLFDAVARESGLSANGQNIARAIASVRLGPDGAPGRAGHDDARGRRHSLANDENFAGSLDVRSAYFGAMGAQQTRNQFDQYLRQSREPAGVDPGLMLQRQERRRDLLTKVDDPAADFISDIRLPAFGDDVRFGSVGDLLQFRQIRSAGLTPELLEAAKPHLTVFSTSVDERVVDFDSAPFVDINRASPEEIFEALSEVYPDRNPRLLQQFAVNIVDARDFNSIPTVFPGTEGPNVILGVERTPFITEIYPDSLTPNDEGDEGQFIELHNPWPERMDVNGWTVNGPGGRWTLNGAIAPGGFLILTDDIDNRRDHYDRHTPGTGSLYDIFRILPDGNRRRAIEPPGFSIPAAHDSMMTYELRDQENNLIDSFTFRFDRRYEDSLYSWQRENPMVRHATPRRATPFGLPQRSESVDSATLAKLQNYPPDAPFASPVDAMRVFAGFADPDRRQGAMWEFPVVGSPYSANSQVAEDSRQVDRLDARLLDVFTISDRPIPARSDWARLHGRDRTRESGVIDDVATGVQSRLAEDALLVASGSASGEVRRILENEGRLGTGLSNAELHQLLAVDSGSSPAGVVHGRVNVNTADRVVLSALPGISRNAADELYERRLRRVERAARGEREDGVTYRRYSDLLVDDLLWGSASDDQRLAGMERLLPHVSLNSRAFMLVGQPRVEAPSERDQQRAARVEALVALDRGTPEIIYLRKAAPRR